MLLDSHYIIEQVTKKDDDSHRPYDFVRIVFVDTYSIEFNKYLQK